MGHLYYKIYFLYSADIPPKHFLENIGPVQSAVSTELRENADKFTASDLVGHDLTGGNLKLLTRSLQALTQEGRPDELEVALDVRPVLVQASNLLVRLCSVEILS